MFQSTRPHGARHYQAIIVGDRRGFNPRAHTGRDLNKVERGVRYGVSIHAPTRGATL